MGPMDSRALIWIRGCGIRKRHGFKGSWGSFAACGKGVPVRQREAGFVQWSRPALAWLVEPALALKPGSWWREALLSSAVLLARGLLVVYQARERVLVLSGATRGERATHNDNERL